MLTEFYESQRLLAERLGPEIERRQHGNPMPRLTRLGYTVRAGSPTTLQIRFANTRWRRVYVSQDSNVPVCFVRVGADRFYVSP